MLEYIVQHLWLVWVIVMMLCLIIEINSGDFFVTCFAIGALFALFGSFFYLPFWLQVLLFAVCSVLSILFIRPPLLRALHAGADHRVSNANALIGRVGIVEERIAPDASGYVKIDGDVWRAITAVGDTIEPGEQVRVMSMESIVITVERVSR